MTSYTSTEGTTATYAYDAMERRIAKTVDGVVTAYIYDASAEMGLATDDILLEFDTTDPSLPILIRRWLHSYSVDEPIAFETYVAMSGAGSGSAREVFADRQGSVISIVDPVNATLEAQYEYDAFGTLSQIAGTLQQPYGYTGREYDAESGLYYYRARTYDPATGMFLQSDPIGFAGRQLNIFAYVGNNPFRWSDPSGLLLDTQKQNRLTAKNEYSALLLAQSELTQAAIPTIGNGIMMLAARISVMLSAINSTDTLNDNVDTTGESEECRQLAEKIENIRAELFKRVDDIKNNPNRVVPLPQYGPGPVIPPFLIGRFSRIQAAFRSFCIGVIPPMSMLGRSLL